MIQDKRILIAGGAGSIGTELTRQLGIKNKVFILDNDETRAFGLSEELKAQGLWVDARIGDIRNRATVRDLFEDFKPQIIINAAALKHVSPSQRWAEEYVETNIVGNMHLIHEAKRWECFEKYLFISTDKAVADDKNVMGATKMCSETITRTMGPGFIAVRFGNVQGSRGSVYEIWAAQYRRLEPLTITDIRMQRYKMTIPEACTLVIEAIEQGTGGEVFILDMGPLQKVIDWKNEVYGPDYPIKEIGMRPGESLTERLMTTDEEQRAIKNGNFWIIK